MKSESTLYSKSN